MTATLGLDIGGSKTMAVRAEDGVIVAEACAGSANLASAGVAEAGRQLDLVLERVHGHGVPVVCAGAAGADTPEGRARLRDLLAERLPDAIIHIVHDSELVLAAAGVDDGVALISGTGSVAWGRYAGRSVRAGGWGYLLGDQGSGYWVAREAVRRALARVDRGEPADRLGQALAAECGLRSTEQLLDHFYNHTDRRYWARRARIVFEQAALGDPVASAIVDDTVGHLAELVLTVTHRLSYTGPVIVAGGLAVHQPRLQQQLRHTLTEHGLTDLRVLDTDPVRGALRLAQRIAERGAAAVAGQAIHHEE
ncbi:ATPase [Nocardia sp. CDC159]|uniref:ATPase n=1 Tax=Nocardia pulmonis TaxID=2951408 RepID=A0A9X2IYQ5_9NOCA|nr:MULTISPECIES: BadF/BadG/BcrA/BcrD ATPase family protein [Nocardia]MCM6774161.1 ATPase [Nocardia pulmonis]MCM6787048.1 ATPase [Nocardia sp. CDC159]